MKSKQRIDFGTIRQYFPDRGFGFIDSAFSDEVQRSVFFHIKTIKASNPNLVIDIESLFSGSTNALDTPSQWINNGFGVRNTTPPRPVRFWFKYESTPKGAQVSAVLDTNTVQKTITGEKSPLSDKVEDIWMDIRSALPDWLHEVTVASLGSDRATELVKGREELEKKQKEIEEARRTEFEAEQKRMEAERRECFEERKRQEKIEEDEFDQLVAEVRPRHFRYSNQLSQYIVTNRLGYKYKNISGILEMEKNGNSWNLDGGFPGRIYARLCKALDLSNQGSSARPRDFTPYKTLLK